MRAVMGKASRLGVCFAFSQLYFFPFAAKLLSHGVRTTVPQQLCGDSEIRASSLHLVRYLLGVTEERRQMTREEILSTRVADFNESADAIQSVKDKGVVVVVASQDDVDAANKEHPNFF